MAANISLRPATPSDVPQLFDVLELAFQHLPLDSRVFPSSDPATKSGQIQYIEKNLSEITVAEDAASPEEEEGGRVLLAWARWVRRDESLAGQPRFIITPDMYPPTGDRDLGVRFFQNNVDQTRAMAAGQPHWFLSIMVVRPTAQRRGVGGALMRHGLGRVDEDGWPVCVNASGEGKGLYERFGFETVADTAFEHGIHVFHMKRPATRGSLST